MAQTDRTALFTSALNTMNAALADNSDRMPFKQILSVAESTIGDRPLGVAVYKDSPDDPHDYFTIRFSNGAFELVSRGKQDPDLAWKVSEPYLERLAENPERYAEDPFKLDFDWLKSRLGVDE